MGFEIDFAGKHDEAGIKTLLKGTDKVRVCKVLFQHTVIAVVLEAFCLVVAVLANVTLLVSTAHVYIQFVVRVKVLFAEAAVSMIAFHVSIEGLAGV